MTERLDDFINEGKYAKYLTKGKKARQTAATSNKEYNVQFKALKKKLSEINKTIDKHMAMQKKDPLEWRFVGEIQNINDQLDQAISMIIRSTK